MQRGSIENGIFIYCCFSFEHSTKEYACEILGLRTNVFAVHDAEATDKKVLGDFWSKNHNTIKNKLEKGKIKSLYMYDVLSAGALLYCITTQLEKITNSLKRLLKRREKNRP